MYGSDRKSCFVADLFILNSFEYIMVTIYTHRKLYNGVAYTKNGLQVKYVKYILNISMVVNIRENNQLYSTSINVFQYLKKLSQ